MCVVDVETLVEEMVDAFQSVLIVLPRGPSDDENYSRFIERTRTWSYNPPFCAPRPPFENMKVPASRCHTIHTPHITSILAQHILLNTFGPFYVNDVA